ncbi:indolepyruvate ferredoxin oxidoreductase family protein [Methylocapsa palsarum]|uniref:Indolepyruvate ferredoxin oxidoreductase n=1 Tax=Methylocapsa palsarum TaxID=1612308 RepID=A0A1I3Z355_9HYPH|nr:indolepyruvate ferredoxin oxidoreductase family protein [Methylocapsa palsarum]SFK38457.1 indolepyruvate ferredoxin oxidoreductase [Methylocapsa palsarum]
MADVVEGPVDFIDDLKSVSLNDKYDLTKRRIFVSGPQAVIRLLLMQKEIDRRAGLNTAGFISGYPGSPLGGLDHNFLRAGASLAASDVVFQPGLNEDLAATAIWGAQQAEMRGEGKFDGVFSLWYGKGPGVDRSGDVLRHVNLAGTARNGGVLALMGDDHTAESSTTAHQSEFTFVDVMIPILSPAGVQEIVDFGLYGYAMSRFTGAWVALKCLKDTIESTGSIDVSFDRVAPRAPADFVMPPGGLNIRPGDKVLDQEKRLQNFKRDAMLAWLRANQLNRIVTSGGRNAKIGVIAAGKSYLDVRQAMDDLGIDEAGANALGLRLYKIGCAWPLEPEGLRAFARGLELIIVVEEKRSLIEVQVREELYGAPDQPVCIGKKDEQGRWLFPVTGALDANDIAIAIGRRILRFASNEKLEQRVQRLERAQSALSTDEALGLRSPYFCSGCPHNTSTRVPEGMRAYAGIGCHYMAQWMDRSTEGFTQMGGEGANWVGEAPFSKRPHVFQNLGDGTYNHSGILALRFAVTAGVNITYKILFNGVVAMTGGQRLEGHLTPDKIARQVAAEGVARIVIVTDEPGKYPKDLQWPDGAAIRSRRDLDAVQRELAAVAGVTVLIYDQGCASEKRRQRKRGEAPDPGKRVIINELVCEGCGDCGVKSNCVSVQPLETEFGRKRMIDQSSCNKDFSCLEGFCPSFVTVRGAQPKRAHFRLDAGPPLPHRPDIPEIGTRPYGILVTGVGGTGVVTIGAILGMAAHLEGKGCGSIDMAGLAQKGGAVFSHVKIARSPGEIHAIRVAAGEADLVLGCDLVVSSSKTVLAAMRAGDTGVLVNTAEIYPGDFTRNAEFRLPTDRMKRAIRRAAGETVGFIDATWVATALLGNSIAANMFMLGHAWQQGLVPLDDASLLRALELNGEAVEMNTQAFLWGRRHAADPGAIEALAARQHAPPAAASEPETLDQIIARRAAFLTAYQNPAYAARYMKLVDRAAEVERARVPGGEALTEAVARYFFKLMAIKDEYEVARLYSDGSFARQLAATFEGDLKLEYHLAPPFLARKGSNGEPLKISFGSWMAPVFKILASLKVLRGTPLDVFSYTKERRAERKLIDHYEILLDQILDNLRPENAGVAQAIASIPEKIRGYGHIKARHIHDAKAEEIALLAQFHAAAPVKLAAE